MDKYYLQIIALEGCPHSRASIELAEKIKEDCRNIIKISHEEKHNYKNNDIDTFPQIYLMKQKGGSLLLGGNSDFQKVYTLYKNNKNYNLELDNFLKENTNWNKKSALRLINIINS
jgi:glutaredoxin